MRRITLPIYLATALAVATPLAAQDDLRDILSGVARTVVAQELDKKAYAQAQGLNTAAAYRSYLEKYPQGAFAAQARTAVAALDAGSIPPRAQPDRPQQTLPGRPAQAQASSASVEAAIGLTRAQRVEIQQQLTSLGYPNGVADGLWGSNTRGSIKRWQTANKLSPTGYVTAQEVRLIQDQAGSKTAPTPGAAAAAEDRVEEGLLSLTANERREVQRQLTSLGYSTGGVDGVIGANTRRALSTWQRDEGLRASGYLTADQVRELRRQAG